MAIIATGGCILNNVYAETDVVDDVTVTVPESCSLSSNIPSGQEHTAEIVNNHYEENIGTTNFTVYCNDNEGFAVYAIGYSNDTPGTTDMLRVTSNNPMTLSSDIVIPTGTGTTSQETSGASNWAMKLTAGRTGVLTTYNPIIAGSTEDTEKQSGDTNYSNYAEVPSEYTKVAYLNSATDIPYVPEQGDPIEAVGSNFTSTYAVYISPTQPAGTYNGKVKYTVVHPANATVPQELTLQNTAGVIAAIENSDDGTARIKDARDGTEYLVGKLADDNIWLLDNLSLDLTDSAVQAKMNHTNTNAPDEAIFALFHGGGTGNLARSAVAEWQSDNFGSYTEPLTSTAFINTTLGDITPSDEYAGMDKDWIVGAYYNFS